MKKTLKKTLLTLLAIITMTVIFCFGASAATSGYYTYTVTNGEATITDVDTTISGNVTVPSTLGGCSVTTIGDESFRYCSKITSVTIGNSITTIGDKAFCSCDNLASITVDKNNKYYCNDNYGVLFNKDKTKLIQYPIGNTRTAYIIPNNVTTIGDYSFWFCKILKSVTLPESVTTIGDHAFYTCDSLISVTIPNSVITIGISAFTDCDGITSVIIPDSVTAISDYAFSDCNSLTSITVDENNKNYCSDDYGVLFNKNKTELIQYPIGNTRTAYIIPDSVTTIGSSAFYDCGNLTSVIIPDSVTTIERLAFYRCDNLISVTIPDSVTTIEGESFYYCSRLQSITIGNSVTTIGHGAFMSCSSLKDVYYCGTQEQWLAMSIGSYNTNLTNATIYYNCCGSTHRNIVDVAQQNPTCTETGYTAGKYCANCEEWLITLEVIPAKHSNVTKIPAKLSTCDEYGYTESEFCNDCQSYITPKTIFPLTHVDNDNDGKCDECKNAIVSDAVEIKTDLIRVIYTPQHYTGNEIKFEPVVVYENTILKNNVDYTLYFTDNIDAGNKGSLTVKGTGDYNFINKTVNFNIPTADISDVEIADISDVAYYGFACVPELDITFNGKVLKKNRDYVVQCINNCKPGVATVRVIGKGNFSGFIEKEYNIIKKNIEFDSENIKLDDITSPGELYSSNNNLQFLGSLNSGSTYWLKKDCYATFSFNSEDYKTDGWCLSFYINDELIYSNDLKPDNSAVLPFSLPGKYKVVCEVEVDNGHYSYNYQYVNGQVVLVKKWVSKIEKHSQTIDLMVYTEESLPAPKTLVAEVPILYDTKQAFISLESQDKVLVDLDVDKWNTSDAKIATVDNGRVVFHKSGEVTISAQKGNLTATWTFDNEPLNLEGNTQLLNFNPDTNEITVLYKNEILDVDDYILSVRNVGRTTVVTVQGRNLFTGKIEGVFDSETGLSYYCEHEKNICSSSIIRQSTCVKSGVKRFVCNCGISYTGSIAKTAHTYKTSTTKATLSKNGKAENKCTVCGYVKNSTTVYSPKTFTLSTTKYTYDGKNKTPAVTVKDSTGKKLVKGTDYKLTVASKRSAIGRYTVKVTFMGNYSGTKYLYFYILPGKSATAKSSAQTSSAIKLTWSKVAGAAGYTVYRYSPSKKAYVKAGATTGTSFTVKNLLAGTKYTFRVVAYGKTASGKVYNSNTYALIKTATCTATPTVKLASTAKGRATIAWTNVAGETGYQVYCSTSKSSGYKRIANYKANSTKAYKTGLTSGKTYYFRVRAYTKTDSGYVYSPFSAVKSVKVK